MSTALARLRQATRPLHDRTETVVGADRILSGAITPAEFDCLLRCNYYLYTRIEPPLQAAAAQWAAELSPLLPTLLPALTRACAQRRISLAADYFSGWPAPALDYTSRPALYGIGYVLLGSHLGGKVLFRALAQHPVLSATGGLDFHAALATTPAADWRRFRELLAEHLQTPAAIETAVAQARATFDFFYAVYREGMG